MERGQQGKKESKVFKTKVTGLQYNGEERSVKVRCPLKELVTVYATTGKTGSGARVECPIGNGYCDAIFAEQTDGDPYTTPQNLTVSVKAECNPEGYID